MYELLSHEEIDPINETVGIFPNSGNPNIGSPWKEIDNEFILSPKVGICNPNHVKYPPLPSILVALNWDFGLDYKIPYEEDDKTYEDREDIIIEVKPWIRPGRKPEKDKR